MPRWTRDPLNRNGLDRYEQPPASYSTNCQPPAPGLSRRAVPPHRPSQTRPPPISRPLFFTSASGPGYSKLVSLLSPVFHAPCADNDYHPLLDTASEASKHYATSKNFCQRAGRQDRPQRASRRRLLRKDASKRQRARIVPGPRSCSPADVCSLTTGSGSYCSSCKHILLASCRASALPPLTDLPSPAQLGHLRTRRPPRIPTRKQAQHSAVLFEQVPYPRAVVTPRHRQVLAHHDKARSRPPPAQGPARSRSTKTLQRCRYSRERCHCRLHLQAARRKGY